MNIFYKGCKRMNMKKILVLFLSLVLIISLTGCGSDNEADQPQEEESEYAESENEEDNSEVDDGELTPEEVIAALEAEESENNGEEK